MFLVRMATKTEVDSVNGAEEPVQKKQKLNRSVHDSLQCFSGFSVEEVLSENPDFKRVVVKGKFSDDDGIGIIIMEKKPFVVDEMKAILTEETSVEKAFGNDLYGNYTSFVPSKYNGVKTVIIHPATQKHIEKYQKQEYHIVDETGELYRTVTLPFLEKSQFAIQWVYNILDHSSEADRIVFEDTDAKTGFIMVPDLKWDGTTMENLYILALVLRKDLKSVRDLTSEHLPLLYNLMTKGTEAIKKKYDVNADSLRIYFHYQPSYYHLHIHFAHVRVTPPGITTPNAIMLSSVISNIEMMSDYYQKVTLPFQVRENDKLYNEYVEAGVLPKKSA